MKIINKTRYQTRSLRKLAFRVAEDELDKRHKANVTVQFIESSRGVSRDGRIGSAWKSYSWVDIVVPKNPKKVSETQIAHTIAHEFAHIRGVGHKDMRNSPRYAWTPGWKAVVEYAKAPEFEIIEKPIKKKLRRTKDVKLEAAKRKVRLWETKRKLADTKLKTWNRKVKYYERQVAAAQPPPIILEGFDEADGRGVEKRMEEANA